MADRSSLLVSSGLYPLRWSDLTLSGDLFTPFGDMIFSKAGVATEALFAEPDRSG